MTMLLCRYVTSVNQALHHAGTYTAYNTMLTYTTYNTILLIIATQVYIYNIRSECLQITKQ